MYVIAVRRIIGRNKEKLSKDEQYVEFLEFDTGQIDNIREIYFTNNIVEATIFTSIESAEETFEDYKESLHFYVDTNNIDAYDWSTLCILKLCTKVKKLSFN